MKIVEVQLENFKNYDEKTFSFAEGNNAISGPNGSGKTSIIEAISWTLFDYLPYKQEDVIKMTRSELTSQSASKKVARVQVTFISDLDEREYIVCRNTRSQYYIIDKESKERLAEGKREAIEFLKKHYNLPSSANLEEIFINTIGVPQGNFTSIFLDTATKRKDVFDKVLNLEDYRKAYEKLKDFKSFLKDKTTDIRLETSKYELEIAKIPQFEVDIKQHKKNLTENQNTLNSLTDSTEKIKAGFKEQEDFFKELEGLNYKIDKEKLNLKHIEENINNTKKHQEEAKKAKEKLEDLKEVHEQYISTKNKIKKLEEQKEVIDKTNEQINKQDKELQNVSMAIKTYEEKLQEIADIKLQVKELEPLLDKQNLLETERKELEKHKEKLRENESSLKHSSKEIKELQEQLESVEKELLEFDEIKKLSDSYEKLNQQHGKIQKTLNEIKSILNENQKMASQVEGGLCPFLKEICKNMSEGQDLNSYFQQKISELETEYNRTQNEFIEIEKQTSNALEANKKYSKLEISVKEKEKLTLKITALKEDIENTNKVLQELSDIPEKLNIILKDIESLGSPKDKIDFLNQQMSKEKQLENSISTATKQKQNVQAKINSLTDSIKQLDFEEAEYKKLRELFASLETSYNEYLKNEVIAKDLEKINSRAAELNNQYEKSNKELAQLQKTFDGVNKKYDAAQHKELKEQLENQQAEIIKLTEVQKNTAEKLANLEKELQKLIEMKTLIEKQQKELEKIEKLDRFTDTARDILKTCGPQVGRFYIENISIEANNLYQDITQQQTQSLNWSLDYNISVEESGHGRAFPNLSGGEQMAAALAVRLSLLRELSDINIAFFDEPTTNMDEIRRLSLAEQIRNITDFDQLFIISHDDTFEKDIDNVIRLN